MIYSYVCILISHTWMGRHFAWGPHKNSPKKAVFFGESEVIPPTYGRWVQQLLVYHSGCEHVWNVTWRVSSLRTSSWAFLKNIGDWNYKCKRYETKPLFRCQHFVETSRCRVVLSAIKVQATHHWCMILQPHRIHWSTGPLVGYGTFFFGGEFVVVHLRQKIVG